MFSVRFSRWNIFLFPSRSDSFLVNAFARRNIRTMEKRRRRCRLHRRLHHSRGGKVVFHLNIFPLPEHKEVTESFPHSHSKGGFLLLGKNRRYQSCARLFLASKTPPRRAGKEHELSAPGKRDGAPSV